MVKLDISAQPNKGVVTLRLGEELSERSSYIELTTALVAATISNLLAAWSEVEEGGNHPADPGGWFFTSAIESPAWKVGVRPMDGAITLMFSPMKATTKELWLTYSLPRSAAAAMKGFLEQALARPGFDGSA